MYVLPLKQFLAVERPMAHQDLKESGQLAVFHRAMGAAVFVSHEWCSHEHPDPKCRQLATLQIALRNIADGTLAVEADPVDRATSSRADELSSAELKELSACYVWYDYFSVPQLASRTSKPVGVSMQAAVDSLPAYVEHAKYFLVLAPTVGHLQRRGSLMGYETWRQRGWCRVERAARALLAFPVGDAKMLVVRGAERAHLVGTMDFLFDPPGMGTFTVDKDQDRVAPVMQSLVATKLEELLAMPDLHQYRLLLSLRESLFEGLAINPLSVGAPDFRAAANMSGMESSDVMSRAGCRVNLVDSFFHEYGFAELAPNIQSAAGWMPMHYAAAAGNVVVAARLLDMRASVNRATTQSDPCSHTFRGTTPLFLCGALSGSRNAMDFLLERRAEVNSMDERGLTPLAFACVSGKMPAIESLLMWQADPRFRDVLGRTALDQAATFGREEVVRLLLQCRSLPSVSDHGLNALHWAARGSGSAGILRRLLAARGSPTARANPGWFGPQGTAAAFGSLAYRLGRRSSSALLLHHEPGSTPLMAAALVGHREACRALLRGGADPHALNDRGLTASKLAALVGLPEDFVDELAPGV